MQELTFLKLEEWREKFIDNKYGDDRDLVAVIDKFFTEDIKNEKATKMPDIEDGKPVGKANIFRVEVSSVDWKRRRGISDKEEIYHPFIKPANSLILDSYKYRSSRTYYLSVPLFFRLEDLGSPDWDIEYGVTIFFKEKELDKKNEV